MTVVVITPPAPILAAADVRNGLALAAGVDTDAFLQALASAVQAAIDGPTGDLGRAIGTQTLELRIDQWWGHRYALGDSRAGAWDSMQGGPGDIRSPFWTGGWPQQLRWNAIQLPFPPFASITSITYFDLNGVQQTLASNTYQTIGGGENYTYLLPVYGSSWPQTQFQPEGIKIRYQAGYSVAPPILVQAMLLMVRNLYGQVKRDPSIKSETATGIASWSYDASGKALLGAVEALVSRYRLPAL